MVDLDQSLNWETSALGTKLLVDYLIENKVRLFMLPQDQFME